MASRYVALIWVCGSLAAVDGRALAQDGSVWSGSIDLVSDYVFRGISQNNRDIALQAGVEYEHASGFYAGAWGSNVSWLSDGAEDVSSSIELDGYAGWRGTFDNGVQLDAGVVQYHYPGNYPAGFTRPYTTEPFVAIGYAGVSLGYAHSLTNLFGINDSKNSGYLSLSYEREFDGGWILNAGIGRQRIANDADASYTDWSIGAGKTLGAGFSLGINYVDTNADKALYTNAFGETIADSTVVLRLSASF